jgi:cobalt transporter subunit CbtA
VLQRILLAGVLAGLAAGLVLGLVHLARLTPLIIAAEAYETAPEHHDGAAPGDAAHEDEWMPRAGLERTLFTLLADLVVGAGFGLMLCGAFALRQGRTGAAIDLREGLIWGGAGFAAFALAPALGLPPALPGSELAGVAARQAWWLGTALATAAGVAALAFARRPLWRGLGVLLVLLPHLVGAPEAPIAHGGVPAALAAEFVAASLAAAGLFWIVLGGSAAWLYGRMARGA